MLAEVPILCIGNKYTMFLVIIILIITIDIVNIEDNTTSIQDEYISHRLGLIPLRSLRPMSEWNYNHDCECDYCCDMCSVTFTLGKSS